MGNDVLRSGHQEICKYVLDGLEESHADPKCDYEFSWHLNRKTKDLKSVRVTKAYNVLEQGITVLYILAGGVTFQMCSFRLEVIWEMSVRESWDQQITTHILKKFWLHLWTVVFFGTLSCFWSIINASNQPKGLSYEAWGDRNVRLEDTRRWRNVGIAKTQVSSLDLLVLGLCSWSAQWACEHRGPCTWAHSREVPWFLSSLSFIKMYCLESKVAIWKSNYMDKCTRNFILFYIICFA